MRILATLLTLTLLTSPAYADAVVLKRTLTREATAGEEILDNGGFEDVEDGRPSGASMWGEGCSVDTAIARSGERSMRCSSDDAQIEHGVYFEVNLDQQQPAPVVASGWSRAENVAGASPGGYSLWVDIEFTDGTHSWGNHVPFDPGAEDWQHRQMAIAPSRPIRWIRVFGLFRGHTGTAWFDDYSLTVLDLDEGAATFNGTPVLGETATLDDPEPVTLSAGELELPIDRKTGAFVGDGGRPRGLFLRDVAAGSDFRQPRAEIAMDGDDLVLSAEDEELRLALDAELSAHDDHIAISGTVRDLAGEDRAVSVYLSLPVDATGGVWHDGMTVAREIATPVTYTNVVRSGAGPSGQASRYPLGCVTTDERGAGVAIPMDRPRLAEIAYDGASRELYCAWHLGLTEETGSAATFSAAIYPVDPEWGFRDALRRYYAIYPDCFTKRNQREGIWMPFTDVSTVEGWEDFGFAFHEGDNNVDFDDEADIASFVYCEPIAYWLRMKPEEPRTHENIARLLREAAAGGDRWARSAVNCAVHDSRGAMALEARDVPWCDGARFFLNCSPHLYADEPRLSRGELVSKTVWGAFERNEQISGWRAYESGFSFGEEAGREESGAIRVTADAPGKFGARQRVAVNQEEASQLVISGWGKREELAVPDAAEWWLYVDISYAGGGNLWGQTAVFDPAADGWQQAEFTIEPEKPVEAATVYAILRGDSTGSVVFDDLFFGEPGGDNLLRNPQFEPKEAGDLDGIYIDSSEMAASLTNYRREHWPDARTPLSFDRNGRVCQVNIFNTVEFARALSEPLHERGELLFANSTPNRIPWLAAWLDVMGTESNWSRGDGYTPMSVPDLAYRRALCHQRPFLFLQNTIYDDFKPEWVELYFKRSIAFGHFPSFFSHNAAEDRYWDRPKLYNRDRPLFTTYIPVCATLSRAGWEPVTHARAEPEHVYVERFGPAEDGSVYLTVFNDSDEPCEAHVVIDLDALGVSGAAEEVLPNGPEPASQGEAGTLTVSLDAQDLAVLKLSARP